MDQYTIEKLIDATKNPLITTMDEEGYPVTRAMMKVRVREGLTTLYFSTNTSSNKVREIKQYNKGSVYFFNADRYIGCSLKGVFDVLTDLESKKKVWQDGDDMYYPKGIMDDDFCVLVFRIDKGRIYSNFNSEDF